ncbi:unnamed protein product [Closterium sp. Naga37s-1]|nr:unnamed protein product [Closterium sp. Naga37s-1]
MARASTSGGDKAAELRKGSWTAEEDDLLVKCIAEHGDGNWSTIPRKAGLQRCGKSCRLRWTNYLRPDPKRGAFSRDEEDLVVSLHRQMGNRWAKIALEMPGRTDNDIKNHWNTRLKRRLRDLGVDPDSHLPLPSAPPMLAPCSLLAAALGEHPRKGVSAGFVEAAQSADGPLSKRRRVDEATHDAGFASPTSSSSRLLPSLHAPAAPRAAPRAAPPGAPPSPCSLPPSAVTSLSTPAGESSPDTPSADDSPSASSTSPCDSPSAHFPASPPLPSEALAPAPLVVSARTSPGVVAEAEAKWRNLRLGRVWREGPGVGEEDQAGGSRGGGRAGGWQNEERAEMSAVTGQAGKKEVGSINTCTTPTANTGVSQSVVTMHPPACFEAGLPRTHLGYQAALMRLTATGIAGRVRTGFRMPPRLVIPCLPGDTEADATASAATGVDIPAALGAGEGSNLAGATNDSTMASGRLPSPLVLIDRLVPRLALLLCRPV